MNTTLAPSTISPALGPYALAVSSQGPGDVLRTAGIVGVRPDGTISTEAGEQAADAWRSIDVLLRTAGFEKTHIVSYVQYVVDRADLEAVSAARTAYLDGHLAASALVIVAGLVSPEWKVEVAVEAVRPQ